jgi:murein DD-endopeptidase MepM/ murein hydrolase activator NlpD
MPIAPTTKKISRIFGKSRGKRRHNGIDYDVEKGTPVKASADGIVVRSTMHEPTERIVLKKQVDNMGEKEKKFFGSYGNVIIIYHGQDLKKLKHT